MWIWITITITSCSTSYLASQYLGAAIIAVAGAALLFCVYWLSNATGIAHLTTELWQALSGAATPSQVFKTCGVNSSHMNWLLWLAAMALAIGNLLIGLAAFALPPIGLVLTIGGAIASACSREPTPLVLGLGTLAVGAGAVVLAGIVMHFIHLASYAMC